MLRKKVLLVFVIFICLFSLLSVSLARWQIVEGAKWAQLAEQGRRYTKEIQNQRGVILARDSKMILASNEVVYDIFIYKKNILNPSVFVPKLADALGVTKDKYIESLNSDQIQYFNLAKKVTLAQRNIAVQMDCEMNIPDNKRDYKCTNMNEAVARSAGITVEQTSKRIYPNGSLAAHILGFMGLNEQGDEIGSNGVEGYYNAYLEGKSGTIEGIRDQSGNFILSNDLKASSGSDGTYLQLTLDVGVQRMVEEELKKQVESQHAKGGTVVVMDPSTGDILAMANYPTYNSSKYNEGEIIDCSQPRYLKYLTCEKFWGAKEQDLKILWATKTPEERQTQLDKERNIPGIFTNQGLSEVREPGSIMKVVTSSAAINEGKVQPSTLIPDHPGCIMITDRKVCTANFVGAKGQTVDKMLEISDNIGAYYVAKSLGNGDINTAAHTLAKYLDGFGIGREVRVGLDGESIFPVKNPDDWTEIDLATAAFGQGIVSTNSLENISAIATVANGGKRMQPHIIKRFVSGDKVKDFVPQIVATPITPDTASKVVGMLERGTREGYTAPPLKDVLKNYTMAGKTGTAQISDGKGGYVVGAYNNTYVGFAPAQNPKFIMLVTMREPDGATYASFSAVPVWKNIALQLLPYLGVAPDKK